MPNSQNHPSEPESPVQGNRKRISSEGPCPRDGMPDAGGSGFKRILANWWDAFLSFLDGEQEPDPPPPPEKPLKESVQEFIDRCRDREKRIAMLKASGIWCGTVFVRGTVICILFALAIWGTIRALEFSENCRIKFYPSDEIVDYLVREHENLEKSAGSMTAPAGRDDDIPFERFDAKLIETVKPVRIYSDEYGVYLMTGKGWYNGEHGIFIAKDGKNMPPDINWVVIEGRIHAYAIYE